LQGDKIEDPKYVIENNLTPDYGHYITFKKIKLKINNRLEKLS